MSMLASDHPRRPSRDERYLPEHTHMAYAMAIEQGADFIEPDHRDRLLWARVQKSRKDA